MPGVRFSQAWREAAQRLSDAGLSFGQGTEDASQEAAWMLVHSLGWPLLESFARLPALQRRVVPEAALQRLHELLEQRLRTRRPLAYLLGEAWLHGQRFLCDERAIVPRSLIAELLDQGLEPWLRAEPARIADICTGGASLAILAAQRWPASEVTACDISEPALQLARANVESHGLERRVRLLRSDLFEAFEPEQRFDLVLCNPPYVNETSMRALPREFLHEPRLALAGGDDGMDLVRRLLREAPAHLRPQGVLVVEIGHERAHFEAAFPRLPVHWLPVSAGDDAVFLVEAAALEARA
ncbi:50S ribosomal protein L3 N(5)-glutamine methyltransferase [Thiomonas sp.]|uniref:50S ribosomal protein L3 N(5)-glutamine methyltransferase n=1 Tax=Thiomonas sp. TaxID=2047785 RepID=UPI002603E339|nr:50S ribosomal protein L3 N(5)-glutamine methyltransferase [Thiomonas sp.]